MFEQRYNCWAGPTSTRNLAATLNTIEYTSSLTPNRPDRRTIHGRPIHFLNGVPHLARPQNVHYTLNSDINIY